MPPRSSPKGSRRASGEALDEALEVLSYDNARGVLKRAGEMVRTLVAVGAGRSRHARGAPREGLTVAAIAAAARESGRAPGASPDAAQRRSRRRHLSHSCRAAPSARAPAGRCHRTDPESRLAARARRHCKDQLPGIPVVVYAPFRPDDGELLLACRTHAVASVAVEGVDDAVVGDMVTRSSVTAARRRRTR